MESALIPPPNRTCSFHCMRLSTVTYQSFALIGQSASMSIPVALLAQDYCPARAGRLHPHDKAAVRNIGHSPDMVHLTRNIGSTAGLALLGILTINPVRT